MTLITTVVSGLGMVQLSDSNVSLEDGSTRTAPKLFRLQTADSVLALAGAYSFQGEDPASWLGNVDHTFGPTADSLKEFAERIGQLITINAIGYERTEGHLIHLAGYQRTEEGWRPHKYFIRSWAALDPQGDYAKPAHPALVTEDFWSRYQTEDEYRNAIDSGGLVYFVKVSPRVELHSTKLEPTLPQSGTLKHFRL